MPGVHQTTVIIIFFVVEIHVFSFDTRPKICLLEYCPTRTNISPSKHFLIWIFRTGARTRGVNSGTRWEGELNPAAVNNCKCEGIIAMVP